MELQATYRGPEARRFAQEHPPYGAGWPQIAYEAEVIFLYQREPHDSGARLFLLLGYDGEGNEVRRRSLGGWKP